MLKYQSKNVFVFRLTQVNLQPWTKGCRLFFLTPFSLSNVENFECKFFSESLDVFSSFTLALNSNYMWGKETKKITYVEKKNRGKSTCLLFETLATPQNGWRYDVAILLARIKCYVKGLFTWKKGCDKKWDRTILIPFLEAVYMRNGTGQRTWRGDFYPSFMKRNQARQFLAA